MDKENTIGMDFEEGFVEEWKGKHYSFFTNKECESFPCHKGIAEDEFNCLFCFCPLYALGTQCGGNFKIMIDGTKDCSNCLVPHKKDNYGYIVGRFDDIRRITITR